jgi:hypothetical protein
MATNSLASSRAHGPMPAVERRDRPSPRQMLPMAATRHACSCYARLLVTRSFHL